MGNPRPNLSAGGGGSDLRLNAGDRPTTSQDYGVLQLLIQICKNDSGYMPCQSDTIQKEA